MASNLAYDTITRTIDAGGDATAPFSYYEWCLHNADVGGQERSEAYKRYVSEWKETKDSEVSIKDRVLKDYKDFVLSVYPYIDNTETFNVNDLDLNSGISLELLIPKFVKRIKSMMMYFIEKRISIARSKLKYSMHGSSMSIERMLHEWLLSNYTFRRHHVPGVRNAVEGVTIPNLEDVKDKVRVRIDEYYDDQNYADKNPSHGAASYFTDVEGYVLSGDSEFAESMYGDWSNPSGGTDIIWLFDGGLNERKLDNPIYYSVRDAVLGTSSLDEYEAEKAANRYVFDLTRKYLGNDYGYISGGFYREDWRDFDYDFRAGNNYFYFPSGGQDHQPSDLQINPVNINETTLSANAHGADSYEEADRIFVRKNGNVKGAWLRKLHKDWNTEEMSVAVPLKLGYSFMYPLAGYGTSGEGIEWSGPIYDSAHPLYMALDEAEREVVKRAYWENPPSAFECESMSVQKFNIADMDIASALAGSAFNDSMHMSVVPSGKHKDMAESVYKGDINQLWLYEPRTTEFVVSDCKNYYEFPYFNLDSKDDRSAFFDIKWCDDVALSSIKTVSAFRGAVGGNCPANSDILYKIDDNGKVVEAAWLSAMPVDFLYFTSGTEPTPIKEHIAEIEAKKKAYENAMEAIGGWRGLEFISKYSMVYPTQPRADFRATVSGLFHQYERGFSVAPGEDEYFIYTGWSPYDNRETFGNIAPGGPFVSAIFLGDSPMEEFASIPYYEGCEDYDYIYSCESYPYVESVEDRKKNAIFFSGGQWCCNNPEYNATTAILGGEDEAPAPVILKNVLYKYHRSRTASVPGVFRIINEAYGQSESGWSVCQYDTNEDGSIKYDDGGKPKIKNCAYYADFETASAHATGGSAFFVQPSGFSWQPIEYTRWVKMVRDLHTGEWTSDGDSRASDMILRSGDRIVYDSVKTSRVVTDIPFDAEDYAFELTTIPYVARIGLKNARPYWANALNSDTMETGVKAIDVNGNGLRWKDNCFLLNPEISNQVVNPLDRISVYSNIPFVWKQYVWVREPHDEVAWCKLGVEYTDVPLSSVYGNEHVVRDFYDNYLQVSDAKRPEFIANVISAVPTEEVSDIEFSYTDGDQILINYWAKAPFNWKQSFLNVRNGVPPTGGVFVPYEMSESGVEAIVPWANLSNRHYPSMAVAPDLSKFYRKEDVGGYFLPQYLGVSEAITKDPELQVDFSKRSEGENAIDPITVGETFAQDDGYTNGRENPAIYVKSEYLEWAKVPMGIGANAGMRQDENLAQSFVPYMTQEEARGAHYSRGLHRPDDPIDPFKNDGTYDWDKDRKGYGYDEHFTKQQPIERWANDRFVDNEVFSSKTDMYGFTYALVKKAASADCIYGQRGRTGSVYYRGFDYGVHSICEMSDAFMRHPVTWCGLITNMDVAGDAMYVTGLLPDDPVAGIRPLDAYLAEWQSYFDSHSDDESESRDAPLPPIEGYDGISMRPGDLSELLPVLEYCLRECIMPMMDNLAETYNIWEFHEVGRDFAWSFNTIRQMNECIESLYSRIRVHFVDAIGNLPVSNEWYPWKSGDGTEKPGPETITSPMDAEDDSHPKTTIFGIMWRFITMCRALLAFHLFKENVRSYFVFSLVPKDNGDAESVVASTEKMIVHNEEGAVKFARPWYFPSEEKYVVPVVMFGDGVISAAADTIDLRNLGFDGRRRTVASDGSVYSTISSAVSGSLSATISANWLIDPVASYNNKTENLVIVQQVSGNASEIGPIALFNYNLLDDDIGGTAILPRNVSAEYMEYVSAYMNEHKEVPPASSVEYAIEFRDTSAYRNSFLTYNYGVGVETALLEWGQTPAFPVADSPLYEEVVESGALGVPVDGDVRINDPISGRYAIRMDDLHDGYSMLGVYDGMPNLDGVSAFDYTRPVTDVVSAYVGWKRSVDFIKMVADEFANCYVSYGDVSESDLRGLELYENAELKLEVPAGGNLYERCSILSGSNNFRIVSNGEDDIGWRRYLPQIRISFSNGFRIDHWEVANGGDEPVASGDTNLIDLANFDEEKLSAMDSSCEIRIQSKGDDWTIPLYVTCDSRGLHETPVYIPENERPKLSLNDVVGISAEIVPDLEGAELGYRQTISINMGDRTSAFYNSELIENRFPLYDRVEFVRGRNRTMFVLKKNGSGQFSIDYPTGIYTGKYEVAGEEFDRLSVRNDLLSNSDLSLWLYRNDEIPTIQSAKSYIQDGLIAMWDGIENAGWDIHNPNATVWKDLIGSYDGTVGANVVVMDNCMRFNGTQGEANVVKVGKVTFGSPQFVTFEAVFIKDHDSEVSVYNEAVFGQTESHTSMVSMFVKSKMGVQYKKLGDSTNSKIEYGSAPFGMRKMMSASFRYASDKIQLFSDGVVKASRSNDSTPIDMSSTSYNFYIGGDAFRPEEYTLLGRVFNLRIYNRALTAEEIAANYAIDKARFNLP